MWSRLAFIGGLIQVMAVLALLFLPLYADCSITSTYNSTTNTTQTSGPICESHGYTYYHSLPGDVVFAFIGIVSLAFAVASLAGNIARRRTLHLILGGLGLGVTILGICPGEGFVLIPGAILIIVSIVGEHLRTASSNVHSA